MPEREEPPTEALDPTAELEVSPELLEPAAVEDDDPTEVMEAARPEPAPTAAAAMSARQPSPTEVTTDPRRTGKIVGLTLLALLLLAGTGIGMFFAGQSTRKSESVVRAETMRAVDRAVSVAVERKGADDKAKRLRIMHREATRMNARHRVEIRKMRKVADRKAARAYSSGSAVGHQQGYSDGVDDGITKASDDITCSDDPDVPLPYCFYGDY
ncbi:MAG: hypothetical protein Q7T55_13435 [Solirubrobacteraceae bacterium]|nr:hypothetical protein [Solirubrobacteraceae bacterium]